MGARRNDEYHDFIDDLATRGFYGEVTFFFQGGVIESSRTTERNTKHEVREKTQARRRKRALVPVSRPAAGGLPK